LPFLSTDYFACNPNRFAVTLAGMSSKNPFAVALGRLGGLKKTVKKRAAILKNLKRANLERQRLSMLNCKNPCK
jgi:hypothetical protein